MIIDELANSLRERQPLPPLLPHSIYRGELSQKIRQTDDVVLFGTPSGNSEQREFRFACRSGLLLWNDDLHASHTISQGIETPTGSVWHAIMHRREGDFSNSNYWWRRAGEHPAFGEIRRGVLSTLANEENEKAQFFRVQLGKATSWLPMEFVDLCANAEITPAEEEWLKRVQLAEIEILFNWCRARS